MLRSVRRWLEAELLLLMEAPGPNAVPTGFVSRNNRPPTAGNQGNLCGLLLDAGIDRGLTALWNVVPWYIGTGERIHPATGADVAAGAAHLGPSLCPRGARRDYAGGRAAELKT